jgi:lysophospholipase L1-like esterase
MEEQNQKNIKPRYIAIFMAIVLVVLTLLSLVIPKNGVEILGKKFYFVELEDLFSVEEEERLDVFALLQARQDSLAALKIHEQKEQEKLLLLAGQQMQDSIDAQNKRAKIDPTRLQYFENNKKGLDKFFSALSGLKMSKEPIRVIHFGDSQIEEDRITSLIRRRLQARFGGAGVGLLPAKAVTNSLTVTQRSSENWIRFTAFGAAKQKVEDGRYGASTIMCKYNNFMVDSLDTIVVQRDFSSGFVTISPRNGVHETVKKYNRVRIFMGHNSADVTVRLNFNDTVQKKIVEANTELQILTFDLEESPDKLTITFEGKSSPEVYGISLETRTGIHVDNIAMRGGSGTIFYKLHEQLAKQMFKALNPHLVILQFGGNVMPYMDSEKKAKNYAIDFLRNIKRVKQFCPNASILVIGPSDMSTNVNGNMETYEYLPAVRDALKQAAFDAGGAYFDMYEVMGGKNSMPSWVESNPPLAAKDYIHFSTRGAQKIAELFYEALMLDYDLYLQRSKISKKK